jgi:hypothetical protein
MARFPSFYRLPSARICTCSGLFTADRGRRAVQLEDAGDDIDDLVRQMTANAAAAGRADALPHKACVSPVAPAGIGGLHSPRRYGVQSVTGQATIGSTPNNWQ